MADGLAASGGRLLHIPAQMVNITFSTVLSTAFSIEYPSLSVIVCMQISTAGEAGAHLTAHLRRSNTSLDVSQSDTLSPVTSRSLAQRWLGENGRVRVTASIFPVVAALAAAFLLLHCALFLTNSHRSKTEPRLLSVSKGTTDKNAGGPCAVSGENHLDAASAAGEEEVLVEQELVEQAHRYVRDMKRLVASAEPVLLQLKSDLKAKCTAAFLCLFLVEFSALLCLLEKRQRAGMNEEIVAITARIQSISRTISRRHITRPQHRHIKCLQDFLDKLPQVQPVGATIAERQRLQALKHLLQLQEAALAQLNAGCFWLRESLEGCKKEKGGAQATAAADGAAKGSTQGAAPAPAAPKTAAHSGFVEVIHAMEATIHLRRKQVLIDPLVSRWLRDVHAHRSHYGLVSPGRLEALSRQPLQTHSQLLEALQATPLGTGDDPRERIRRANTGAQKRAISAMLPDATSGGEDVHYSEDPTNSSHVPEVSQLPLSRNRDGSSGTGSPSASPNAYSTASAARVDEKEHASLQDTSKHMPVPVRVVQNILTEVSPPAGAERPQVPALSAAPEPAVAFSAHGRSSEDALGSASSVEGLLGLVSSAENSMSLPPSFYQAPVPAAAGYQPKAFTLWPHGTASQIPFTYAATGASVASLATRAQLVASSATHPPTATSTQQGVFDRAPGASRPRRPAGAYGVPLVPYESYPHFSHSSSRPLASGAQDQGTGGEPDVDGPNRGAIVAGWIKEAKDSERSAV
ncbi:hypothetical protein, conserved [Eimeria maxima]|uniref:Uncharacterized protein n=1 Tax=Eimeria maxima TaxID=5804 RepID=U6M960_EIMMA|nr:hypothetical protein, conserved [Eimeria maxima]CDJ60762.1 hypothetical protein, conserved [Eimeria maxima]